MASVDPPRRPWLEALQVDPVPGLLEAGDPALAHLVRRDLLDGVVGPIESLWALPAAKRLLDKQQADGSWRYRGANRDRFPETDYDLLETFRNLRVLVQQYGLNREHPALARAAEYCFSRQTEEGDIRGILGNQTMPYYFGAIAELLIKAGYGSDPRLEKGLDWLLTQRQDDAGWIVPAQAVPARLKTREFWSADPVALDRSLPFSHLATGMVLRALAVHPRYRHRPEVRQAADALKARFFQADRYNDRRAPLYWTKLQFPFWWPNLLTALDTLSLIGYSREDGDVGRGLEWFMANQQPDALWPTGYESTKRPALTAKELDAQRWVALAVCRVFFRFYR